MSVSHWDVNRKIPYFSLIKDIKAGKYPGVSVIKIDKKWGYTEIKVGDLFIEVDADELTKSPKGFADRFDVTLPEYNRKSGTLNKFLMVLSKKYDAKFVSDFEIEDPVRDWRRFSDTHPPAHTGSRKPKVEMDGFMLGGALIAKPILKMMKGEAPIEKSKPKTPGKVKIWGMEFET